MNIKYYYFFLIVTLILIAGCKQKKEMSAPALETTVPTPVLNATANHVDNVTPAENRSSVVNANRCQFNANCTDSYCIDGKCLSLSSLNAANCSKKCSLQEVEVYTSDKETYNFPPGQGSYTAAGALEWEILKIPGYCPTKNLIVPIKFSTKNYGKVYADEVLALPLNKTSKVIKHPLIKDIAFTLTVKSVKEKCE